MRHGNPRLLLPFWAVIQQEPSAARSGSSGSDTGYSIIRTVLKSPDWTDAESSKEKKCELMIKLDFKSVLLVLDMTSLR